MKYRFPSKKIIEKLQDNFENRLRQYIENAKHIDPIVKSIFSDRQDNIILNYNKTKDRWE